MNNMELSSFAEYQSILESRAVSCELEEGIELYRLGHKKEEIETESDTIIGSPETDMENWHEQTEQYSCAISCQEFVAEQLLDMELSEEKMIRVAHESGWYDPERGTTINDVGKLLEAIGLEVERGMHYTIKNLAQELETNGKVLCSVNNWILSNPEFADIPGIQANHVVQLIGIDTADPNDIRVILNDSGVKDGKARNVSLNTFCKAWETGGNYAVFARKGVA